MDNTFCNFNMEKFISVLIKLLAEQEGVEITYELKRKEEAEKTSA